MTVNNHGDAREARDRHTDGEPEKVELVVECAFGDLDTNPQSRRQCKVILRTLAERMRRGELDCQRLDWSMVIDQSKVEELAEAVRQAGGTFVDLPHKRPNERLVTIRLGQP